MRLATVDVVLVSLLALGGCEVRSTNVCDGRFDESGRVAPGTGETLVRRRVDALFAAAQASADAVVEVEDRLLAICTQMAEDLDIPESELEPDRPFELSVTTACAGVVEQMRSLIDANFPAGFAFTIAGGPPQCRVDPAAAETCVQRCDPDATGPARCDGTEVGPCTGTCRGECIGVCGSRECRGACALNCIGACTGVCNGLCDRPCSALDAYDRCIGTCEGTCDGRCSGTCLGSCTGDCTQPCAAECTGVCTGACEGSWTPGCDTLLTLPGDAECALACTIESAVTATCDEPEFTVRGPEIPDGDLHILIDNLGWSTWRHWSQLQSLSARVDALLDPAFERLLPAMADSIDPCTVRSTSDLGRALDRLETLREILGGLVDAATAPPA